MSVRNQKVQDAINAMKAYIRSLHGTMTKQWRDEDMTETALIHLASQTELLHQIQEALTQDRPTPTKVADPAGEPEPPFTANVDGVETIFKPVAKASYVHTGPVQTVELTSGLTVQYLRNMNVPFNRPVTIIFKDSRP